MCEHRYYYSGYRSYSDSIPGYAQGQYFREDQPGMRCHLTDADCNMDNCHKSEQAETTSWLCPACQEKEEDVALNKLGPGLYGCRVCAQTWAEAELARCFTALLARLTEERDEARSKALISGTSLAGVRADLAGLQAKVETAL